MFTEERAKTKPTASSHKGHKKQPTAFHATLRQAQGPRRKGATLAAKQPFPTDSTDFPADLTDKTRKCEADEEFRKAVS